MTPPFFVILFFFLSFLPPILDQIEFSAPLHQKDIITQAALAGHGNPQ